ncbi:MAG: family 10 glycosylhydrolase [Rubrivivax sp.]|nr:family 10 glycosylhydrolase [Rubrivivax sp.]
MTAPRLNRRSLGAAALAALAGCAGMAPPLMAPETPSPSPTPPSPAGPPGDTPPPAPREFRAAWVATVANIDWPSRPGLAAEVMRAEALALLERARTLGLNALILQVRPAGDALYPSALEPWTEYLSGEQGRAPWAAGEAPWDPLAFWVAEAHRRGIELHAWFNPYRARHSTAKSALVAPHIAVRQPAVVKAYGDMLWMDPAEPAAAAHTLAVVADVLRRYDIDGVHIDDYFYPYPVPLPGTPASPPGGPPAPELPFPDEPAWTRYQRSAGTLAREDWRRAQVDQFVQALQRTVREASPSVRFGISPFGLPRPDRRPAGITGFSQFDKLYADAERWLENGWLDYWAPQLYWPITREGQQFPVLLDYWLAQNPLQRHVWPGLFTSKVAAPTTPWPARELLDQVDVLRSRAGPGAYGPLGASGHIHFSLIALQQDREGLATALRQGAYALPALVPATPWLSAPAVGVPGLRRLNGRVRVEPAVGAAAPVRWAVWRRHGGAAPRWVFDALPPGVRDIDPAGADLLWVQGVNRVGQLGGRALIHLP